MDSKPWLFFNHEKPGEAFPYGSSQRPEIIEIIKFFTFDFKVRLSDISLNSGKKSKVFDQAKDCCHSTLPAILIAEE